MSSKREMDKYVDSLFAKDLKYTKTEIDLYVDALFYNIEEDVLKIQFTPLIIEEVRGNVIFFHKFSKPRNSNYCIQNHNRKLE